MSGDRWVAIWPADKGCADSECGEDAGWDLDRSFWRQISPEYPFFFFFPGSTPC